MRFSIRDVLWLTVVVAALVMAWMNYRGRIAVEAENETLRTWNQQLTDRNTQQEQILRTVTGFGNVH